MISAAQIAEYGRLTAPKSEWFAVTETTSILGAIRQFCAVLHSADIAPPSSIIMQSEADFQRLAYALDNEIGRPAWVTNLVDTKSDATGTISFQGILFLNPTIWQARNP